MQMMMENEKIPGDEVDKQGTNRPIKPLSAYLGTKSPGDEADTVILSISGKYVAYMKYRAAANRVSFILLDQGKVVVSSAVEEQSLH